MQSVEDNTKVRKAKLMTEYCYTQMKNHSGQPKEQMYYELWQMCLKNEKEVWYEAEEKMIEKYGYQVTARIIDFKNWLQDMTHTWTREEHVFTIP